MATKTLSLKPPLLSIEFGKGKTFNPVFYYLDSSNGIVDLTGFTARMQARVDDVLLPDWDLTTENGGLTLVIGNTVVAGETIIDAHGIQVLVTDTITESITWTRACYEIELVTPTLGVLPFLKGTLTPSDECVK